MRSRVLSAEVLDAVQGTHIDAQDVMLGNTARQNVERREVSHRGQGRRRVLGCEEVSGMLDMFSIVAIAKDCSLPIRLASPTHLNLTRVMSSFFGQIFSSNTPSSFANESGYCSNNLFLIPLCTEDFTAVDEETSPLDGLKDLNRDMGEESNWKDEDGKDPRPSG